MPAQAHQQIVFFLQHEPFWFELWKARVFVILQGLFILLDGFCLCGYNILVLELRFFVDFQVYVDIDIHVQFQVLLL
jgi:hypothetical protein